MSRASERAYRHIRGMILSGVLQPGAQIGEEHLAESCGVSRTPVRDALRRLEAELFVTRNDSQRCFVAEWSLDDIEDAFELRGMLEAHAAKRAAKRINRDQLERLTSCHLAINQAIGSAEPDVPSFLENNRLFHALIMEAAASDRLTKILGQLVEQPVVLRTALHYDRQNLARSAHEHGELLAAFAQRDGSWAHAVMAAHIRRAFHAYAGAHAARRDYEQHDGAPVRA